ncbi:hypothetical protein GQ457_15G014420 [Hibiscus cannabinus]
MVKGTVVVPRGHGSNKRRILRRDEDGYLMQTFHLMKQGVFSGIHKGSRVITLYVSNLPSKLHWSCLRQIFGFHGDVVDSFIASKLNKYGERFGLVRYSNITDVFRAIERLNDYPLYGSRIAVSLRFNGRFSYWRKVRFVPERDGEKSGFQFKKSDVEILLGETSNGTACTVKKEPMVACEGSGYIRNQLKSIQGQVDEDSLKEGRCVEELDILGSRETFNSGHNTFENHELFLEHINNKQIASGGVGLSWAQVVKGRCPNQENIDMLSCITKGSKTIKDMRLMGFKNHELSTTKFSEDELNVKMVEGQDVIDQNGEKISWEAKVDALNGVVRSGEIGNNDEMEGVANGSMLDLS